VLTAFKNGEMQGGKTANSSYVQKGRRGTTTLGEAGNIIDRKGKKDPYILFGNEGRGKR